jgi:hypothetical protein
MRTALTVSLVIALCAPAGAQSRGARSHQSDRATDEVFHPSIGLPLPPIGLPLPPIGLPPRTIERSERLERPERFERPERPERSERSERSRAGSVVFFGPMYWPYPYLSGTPAPSAPSPAPPVQPQPTTGVLHLELPAGVNPQIYVDGYYVGLLSDANGGDLILEAGGHTIELHQDGYEPVREQLRVPFDGVITYRAAMNPLVRQQSPIIAPPLPPQPSTIYVIPRCYVGNVPPREAMLPAGCDPRDAVEFPSAR